jgi:hypothetical protein
MLQGDDLLNFLQNHIDKYKSFAIRIPEDVNEAPSIEVSREICQDLIMHAMERMKGRIGLEACSSSRADV